MTFSEYRRHFFRSAAGVGSLVAGPLAGLLGLSLGLGAVASALLALGLPALLFALGLATGAGPKAAAREAERSLAAKAKERLEAVSLARTRLAALRLAEPSVAAARDLLVLEAGRYLEAALAGGAYDPAAGAAVEESLALVDAWLKEADESSSERRFGQADAHPFPEAAARVSAALKDKAAVVARGRDSVQSVPTGPDLLAIEEELK
ncbi:MAG TPA: hypothetical protein PLG14_04830 [Spirochaetales bacterium]|nr:hypothetical protein [Spirochaetales bacterium]